jgi:hypothetical protein
MAASAVSPVKVPPLLRQPPTFFCAAPLPCCRSLVNACRADDKVAGVARPALAARGVADLLRYGRPPPHAAAFAGRAILNPRPGLQVGHAFERSQPKHRTYRPRDAATRCDAATRRTRRRCDAASSAYSSDRNPVGRPRTLPGRRTSVVRVETSVKCQWIICAMSLRRRGIFADGRRRRSPRPRRRPARPSVAPERRTPP